VVRWLIRVEVCGVSLLPGVEEAEAEVEVEVEEEDLILTSAHALPLINAAS
jgi:hypothetical protein